MFGSINSSGMPAVKGAGNSADLENKMIEMGYLNAKKGDYRAALSFFLPVADVGHQQVISVLESLCDQMNHLSSQQISEPDATSTYASANQNLMAVLTHYASEGSSTARRLLETYYGALV